MGSSPRAAEPTTPSTPAPATTSPTVARATTSCSATTGATPFWGGDHDDHAWGGYDGDSIDVLPRTTEETGAAVEDPITWFFFAADDPDTDRQPRNPGPRGLRRLPRLRIIYGGWGQDAMQANEGDNGPVEGDRLVDWVGVYNAYYLCPATYGEYVSTRQMSPSLLTYLQRQAEADGGHRRARRATADRLRLRRAGTGLQAGHQVQHQPDPPGYARPLHLPLTQTRPRTSTSIPSSGFDRHDLPVERVRHVHRDVLLLVGHRQCRRIEVAD